MRLLAVVTSSCIRLKKYGIKIVISIISKRDKKRSYPFIYVTFLRIKMAHLVVRKTSTILRFVNLCNDEFFVRSYMVQWMNIISYLASTVDGFLVVTTKENIKENLRVFPSVVTYLVSYETM